MCEDSYLTEVLKRADNFVWSVDCKACKIFVVCNRANMSELFVMTGHVAVVQKGHPTCTNSPVGEMRAEVWKSHL